MKIVFDVQVLKRIIKELREQPRRKFTLNAFFIALLSGFLFFNFSHNTLFGLVFIFSGAAFLYNVAYPLSFVFEKFTRWLNTVILDLINRD